MAHAADVLRSAAPRPRSAPSSPPCAAESPKRKPRSFELNAEITRVDATLAQPGLFARDPAKAAALAKARADNASALAKAEEDWLEASAAFEAANSE